MDWTEQYRPSTLDEVRGNNKARDALREWADGWDTHREAVILHGRPGVGKTSAAHALANDRGWPVIELNASDQRTKAVIERIAGEAAMSGTLTGGEAGRRLVILDEADNLHGNYDRGGAGALTRLVQSANQPIVLIANDYYGMSRGLRNNCRDIEFRDVSARSIRPVLRDICRREGIDYEDAALEAIADRNAGDLRSAINDLQAVAESSETLVAADVVTGSRDREAGIFEFLDAVFKEADAETALRSSYDVDETPDDLIGWIEDNLPKVYEGAELADAYDFLGNADRWLGRVRATQDYGYWRYAADNMTAGVAAVRAGSKGGWTRYGPPSFWRKLGASRSARDKRDYVARRIAQQSGVSMATARRSILPFLATMTHHCTNRGLTVTMTAAYDLDAEHVAFVTGSGKDTNKVQSIVDDAAERREKAMLDHSAGAFTGDSPVLSDAMEDPDAVEDPDPNGESTEPAAEADESPTETQSGLTDFS